MNKPVTLYYAATILFLLLDIVVTDAMIETGVGFVTMEEILNYMIVGGIAYFSWAHGIKLLKEPKI